jgi:hypothetical protein
MAKFFAQKEYCIDEKIYFHFLVYTLYLKMNHNINLLFVSIRLVY